MANKIDVCVCVHMHMYVGTVSGAFKILSWSRNSKNVYKHFVLIIRVFCEGKDSVSDLCRLLLKSTVRTRPTWFSVWTQRHTGRQNQS